MKTTEYAIQLRCAGQTQRITTNVDDTRMPAASDDNQSAIADIDDRRLIIQDQWVRLPMVVPPRVLDWKPWLVAGGAVHFASYEHRMLKKKAGLSLFDDLKPGTQQG